MRLYESRMYTHNIIRRPWVRFRDLDLFDKVEGYDGSWDCRSEAETWSLYISLAKDLPKERAAVKRVHLIASFMNRLTK